MVGLIQFRNLEYSTYVAGALAWNSSLKNKTDDEIVIQYLFIFKNVVVVFLAISKTWS